jgi:hypothetical protein
MYHRAAALCLLALAFAAQAVPAQANEPEVSITGAGQERDADCAAGNSVVITGNAHTINLTGACETVAISGIGHKVTIEQARDVTVDGTKSEVTLRGPARTITVFGDSQKLTGALEGKDAVLEVGGHAHEVAIALRSASSLKVHGVQNVVQWTQENGAVKPRVTLEGYGHKVAAK